MNDINNLLCVTISQHAVPYNDSLIIINDLLEMILNQTQLTEMQELLGDNFTMLLDIFMRDSKIQIEKICEWESASQNPTVMMAAHTLKSSAANLGLDQLASQCDLIEIACHTEQPQDLPELVADIGKLYNESMTALTDATATESA